MKSRFERQHGLAGAGLLLAAVMFAPSASAQMVFDGNVLFNNNATGTLAGQFTGAAASTFCPGYTPATLGTVTYTHNLYADPLLPRASYQANVLPSFQPAVGSPAFTQAMVVPADGFFEQTCYAGAIGPNPGDDWTQGWTYWDSTGANRQDLHLPGMPSPRPLAIYDNVSLYRSQAWAPDSNYLVRGQLRVKDQATLTIPAGVVVFEEFASLGTLIVERGGKLNAIGTAQQPIIVTSDDAPGTFTRGHCGGIVINGRAKTNVVNSCAGDSAAAEGGSIGYYGGSDDNHDAGTLKYVRVEFSGKEVTPNNELNSFTWNACGHNTHGDYLQAYQGADDSFEWFGGAMDQKHLVGIDGTDDGYDWQMGTRNRAQFVILRPAPFFAPSGTQNGDKGIEADDNEFDFNATTCSGRSNTTLVNFTIVGDKRVGANFPGPSSGVNFRRGTGGTMINSVIYNMKSGALRIDDNATMDAHCAALPAAPAVFCSSTTVGVPVADGNVFLARSWPNPARSAVNINFSLPQPAHVQVNVYSADGRLVQVLSSGDLGAGPHAVVWNPGSSSPSGIYYYKVLAGSRQVAGKITRVD